MLQGAAIGAVSGAVGGAVGTAVGTLSAASGATVSSVLAGAAGGMAAGATGAALYGGDVGQGALIGMIAGGIGGYLGTFDYGNPYIEGAVQTGSGAVVGGIVSESTGGKFWEGFASGAISGAVAFAANRMLEGNRFQSAINEQKAKLLKLPEDLGVNPKSAMGFGVEGFLGVEGRFFCTVGFETVASTASLAFFYREEISSLRFSGFHTDHALRPSRAVPLSVGFKWKTPVPGISL